MDAGKVYDPQEVVTIALTKEQWYTVRHCLRETEDCHKATSYWWANGCSDKMIGAETAARYEKAAMEAESLRKVIEEALGEAQ